MSPSVGIYLSSQFGPILTVLKWKFLEELAFLPAQLMNGGHSLFFGVTKLELVLRIKCSLMKVQI